MPGLEQFAVSDLQTLPDDSVYGAPHLQKDFPEKNNPQRLGHAFVVLLQKVLGVLDQPSEFRPIAITNTLGKNSFQ